jgi:hypothetical protein
MRRWLDEPWVFVDEDTSRLSPWGLLPVDPDARAAAEAAWNAPPALWVRRPNAASPIPPVPEAHVPFLSRIADLARAAQLAAGQCHDGVDVRMLWVAIVRREGSARLVSLIRGACERLVADGTVAADDQRLKVLREIRVDPASLFGRRSFL